MKGILINSTPIIEELSDTLVKKSHVTCMNSFDFSQTLYNQQEVYESFGEAKRIGRLVLGIQSTSVISYVVCLELLPCRTIFKPPEF